MINHKRSRSDENADHAIDFLVRELRMPIDVVARLYHAERVKLEAGARITGFISILAARNVRRLLRPIGDSH